MKQSRKSAFFGLIVKVNNLPIHETMLMEVSDVALTGTMTRMSLACIKLPAIVAL